MAAEAVRPGQTEQPVSLPWLTKMTIRSLASSFPHRPNLPWTLVGFGLLPGMYQTADLGPLVLPSGKIWLKDSVDHQPRDHQPPSNAVLVRLRPLDSDLYVVHPSVPTAF